MRRPSASWWLGAAIIAAMACAPARDGPPNLVLILSDDHGWPYYGFMGDPIVLTPNLDRLAESGTVFPQAFTTSSTCQASLLTLLAGLYPHQWQAEVRSLHRAGIKRRRHREIQDVETLPRALARAGYTSFQGGKYWEGTYDLAGFTHGMTDAAGRTASPDRNPIAAGGAGLALARTTMQPLWDFIDAQRRAPFFVWFAPKLPHTPHDAPAGFQELYASSGLSADAVAYYANITRFDDRVGELLEYLDEKGLRENTLVVYLADNGWQQGPRERPWTHALGGPRGKASMYELGFRTPLVVSWPGVVRAGVRDERLVSAVDVVATLADYARAPLSGDRDGRSLRPVLEGADTPLRDVVFGGGEAVLRPPAEIERAGFATPRKELAWWVRTPVWRYIWYPDAHPRGDRAEDELYRIDRDAYERVDVAADHPKVVADLRARLLAWVATTTAPFEREPD